MFLFNLLALNFGMNFRCFNCVLKSVGIEKEHCNFGESPCMRALLKPNFLIPLYKIIISLIGLSLKSDLSSLPLFHINLFIFFPLFK